MCLTKSINLFRWLSEEVFLDSDSIRVMVYFDQGRNFAGGDHMSLPHERKNFTYADYLSIEEDVRYEVIDGRVYNMTPAPTPKHQEVLTQLGADFAVYLRGKKCRAFISPIDVCLSNETDLNKVQEWVEPDLVVVCDKNKISDKRIMGVPDLVIEVLSPSTAKKDRLIKFNKYQTAGVKEYWIVDPLHEYIEVYELNGTVYNRDGIYFKGDTIPVRLFDDFSIDLNNVFREEE